METARQRRWAVASLPTIAAVLSLVAITGWLLVRAFSGAEAPRPPDDVPVTPPRLAASPSAGISERARDGEVAAEEIDAGSLDDGALPAPGDAEDTERQEAAALSDGDAAPLEVDGSGTARVHEAGDVGRSRSGRDVPIARGPRDAGMHAPTSLPDGGVSDATRAGSPDAAGATEEMGQRDAAPREGIRRSFGDY
jgi:hypothetical protein